MPSSHPPHDLSLASDDSGAHLPVGIGWRHAHYGELIARQPAVAFLEVHSENFFADGGPALQVLMQGRALYPISLHGVGLSLGSAMGLDAWHLDQLARLVERVDPVRVSDHASFARVPYPQGAVVRHANDLLPVAFTRASLDIMVRNVQQVQERLARPIAVENLSAYVQWNDADMSEPEFLNQLARRSGCRLLLDVNNLVVNALNAGQEAVPAAKAFLQAIDDDVVDEIHLAGYHLAPDIVVDDHGSRVHDNVWPVYAAALRRFGDVPTVIEWDTNVPPLDVLLEEASKARQLMRRRHLERDSAFAGLAA